ncbi:B-cell receptor CD22-like [Sardina pilchardus]|uniref:B-cell receptor CD22-like n=1 Tax=Sardina pilchardus TaxID=27697 RepID=UPI002E14419B
MYEGRVGYWGNNSVHTLRLANLTQADAREYFFRFGTDKGEAFSGRPGVMLSVTSLRVSMTPALVTEGDGVTLTCSTTCTLSNSSTFTWFKNSRPVPTEYHTDNNHMYLSPASSSDSGIYTCAVRGLEGSLSTAETLNVRYPPRQTSVSVSHSGEIEEGHTVVLSCSCQANPPPHTYTWYRRRGPETALQKVTEEVSVNFTSRDEGLYHCEAHNEIGSQNSSVTEVHFTGSLLGKTLIGIGAIILAVILVFGISLRVFWKRNGRPSEDDKSTENKSHVDAAPVYANIGARGNMTAGHTNNTNDREDHGRDVEYASLQFSASEEQEEDGHTVHIKSASLSTTRRAEDSYVVYSVVSKHGQSQ